MVADEESIRRRWFQFRLRTLLIVATLFVLPFFWLSVKRRQAEQEQTAVAWVRENRGFVRYHDSQKNGSWWDMQLEAWFGPTAFAVIIERKKVSHLTPLQDSRGLEYLYIGSTPVTDLSPLKTLTQLTSVEL